MSESNPTERTLLSFRKALETMQLGVTITDTEGKIFYSNPAEARMHGYDPSELIGKNARIFSPPEFWKPLRTEDLVSIHSWKRETVNLRKNGSRFPVRLMSDVVKDPDGYAIGIITTCEDLTAHVQMERVLLSFQKAMQTMQLGVTITNTEGKILYSNPAEAEMHGYEPDELMGKDARIFSPPEFWKPLATEELGGVTSWKRESINVRKDGSRFPVQLISDMVTDNNGEPIGIITISVELNTGT